MELRQVRNLGCYKSRHNIRLLLCDSSYHIPYNLKDSYHYLVNRNKSSLQLYLGMNSNVALPSHQWCR